jgi:predicted DCC family thiol-disulfide oxidoreductase YuxK
MNPRVGSPVILFDGVCNLCTGGVRWIIRRDRRAVFTFASIQSPAGRHLLEKVGLGPDPGSMILIDEAGVHSRSDAAIRIATRLGFPWSLSRVAGVLPRGIRNAVYSWIARNRYRWFGRRDSCMVPDERWRSRFLEPAEGQTAISRPCSDPTGPAPSSAPSPHPRA